MLNIVAAKKRRWLAWVFFHGAGAGPNYSFQFPCTRMHAVVVLVF